MQLYVFAQSVLTTSESGHSKLKDEIPFTADDHNALVIFDDASKHTARGLYKTAAHLAQTQIEATETNNVEHEHYTLHDFSQTAQAQVIVVRYESSLMQNPNQLLLDIQNYLKEKDVELTATHLYTNNFRQHVQTKTISANANVTSHFVTPANPFAFSMRLPVTDKMQTTKPATLMGQFSQTFKAQPTATETVAGDKSAAKTAAAAS